MFKRLLLSLASSSLMLSRVGFGAPLIVGEYLPQSEIPNYTCQLGQIKDIGVETECTGILFSKDALLTAGHCAQLLAKLLTNQQLLIRCPNSISLSVTEGDEGHKILLHPDYNWAGNDIAVLKLSVSIDVQPARLVRSYTEQEELIMLDDCRAIGWGNDNNGQALAVHAAKIKFKSKGTGWSNLLEFFDAKNGATKGDSGGPLVCRNAVAEDVVIGVFYTYVNNYAEWISRYSPLADTATSQWIDGQLGN